MIFHSKDNVSTANYFNLDIWGQKVKLVQMILNRNLAKPTHTNAIKSVVKARPLQKLHGHTRGSPVI